MQYYHYNVSDVECTVSLKMVMLSIGVSGVMPWPRFAMYRCLPNLRTISSVNFFSSSWKIISLQLKSKQSVEFKHKTTHWTLVQILRIEIALQGDIRTDCLTSHQRIHCPVNANHFITQGSLFGQ